MSARVSRSEFDEIVARVRRWGRPGVPDEPALFRTITPAVTAAALAEAVSGRTVSLGRPWSVVPAVDNLRPAQHYYSALGDVLVEGDVEPSCYKDFIGVDYHGKVMSHIDAFSHIGYEDRLFGGASASGSVTIEGMASGDVTEFGPFVTRGVLIDMTAGRDWCESDEAWSLEEVRAFLDAHGIVLRPGDAVLFRSGHDRRRAELGPWDADAAAAGLHVTAVPWFFEQGVAVFGADGETDARPSPVDRVTLPIHVLALTMAGVPLLDNLDLDELGRVCAELDRYTFALCALPLNIPGATGSPLNPVAIF